jgi:DNA polymerase-4
MDCFFAAIEMRDNPELVGKPIAVAGDPGRRGVVSTCNYEARKFGVRSAMATAYALKICPKLILVDHHFDKYKEASEQVREIFYEYTDLVQPLSLDEAYLDVTEYLGEKGSATHLAQEIRQKIYQKTNLTASAGIAPNKLIAKIASDINKPNGQCTVGPKDIEKFMHNLPVEKIFGVGKVTAKKMHGLGLKTCGDLQKKTHLEMSQLFGSFGETLYYYCRGEDNRPVKTDSIRKSLSTEHTYAEDIEDEATLKEKLLILFEDLDRRLAKKEHDPIKNCFVKIKYADFKVTTIEKAAQPSLEVFEDLFFRRWNEKPLAVRLLGVGVRFDVDEEDIDDSQLELL